MNTGEQSVAYREKHGSPIYTGIKQEIQTMDDLAIMYTPGIAEPCRRIAEDISLAKTLTIKKSSVAFISDGSAVLGLGNIGPEASLPVMEGKAMVLKSFTGLDGFPLVLNTQNVDEIVQVVAAVSPTFGAINLEDISAPRCFEIEEKLQEMLDIPVFHDDQHGTAMIVLAGLINALKLFPKEKNSMRIVISGAGAAGIAIGKLLRSWGADNIIMLDSKGIIHTQRNNLNKYKQLFAIEQQGTLANALQGADVFIGVSGASNSVTKEMIENMNADPFIFALSNPDPEVDPALAWDTGAAVVATGRSDYPNQLNNALAYPALFKGLLESSKTSVTPNMMLEVAQTLADVIDTANLTPKSIIPNVFNTNIVPAIVKTVINSKA
jgi:malate dehydrogenase (oxaloacetate-decarboxylating)